MSSSLPQAGGRGSAGGLGKCASEKNGASVQSDLELTEGEVCSGGWAWSQWLRTPNRRQGLSVKPQHVFLPCPLRPKPPKDQSWPVLRSDHPYKVTDMQQVPVPLPPSLSADSRVTGKCGQERGREQGWSLGTAARVSFQVTKLYVGAGPCAQGVGGESGRGVRAMPRDTGPRLVASTLFL